MASDNIEMLNYVTQQCHFFLEWRHKIMLRLGAALAGLALVFAQFSASDTAERQWTLLAGAAAGVGAALLDFVNMRFVRASYRTGAQLENALNLTPGVFLPLKNSSERWWWPLRQTHVLRGIYLAISAACIVGVFLVD